MIRINKQTSNQTICVEPFSHTNCSTHHIERYNVPDKGLMDMQLVIYGNMCQNEIKNQMATQTIKYTMYISPGSFSA